MSPNQHFRLCRFWPAWATLVLGLATSAWLGWRLHRQAVELDRLRLQRIAEVVRDRLHTKVQTTDLIMRQAQDYFGSQENITEGMFREWCRKYGWSITAPWMHGMALFTNLNAGHWHEVMPSDPATWTAVEFRVFEGLARQTPVNVKLAFSYSHDPTKRWPANYATLLRFDERDRGLAGAIYYNTPHTTDRQLVIEHANGNPEYGATVAVPLYEGNRDELHDLSAGPSPKANAGSYNWNLSRGLLLAPLDYITLESLIWGDEPKEVGVEIFASRQPRHESWLNEANHQPRALNPAFKPYLTVSVPWNLYNRRWTLFVYTLPAFEAGSPRYMARLTFGAGAAMTLLATALVGLGLRARDRQEVMTEQIREARDALAAAQQEREKFSRDLHDGAIQSLYAIQLGLSHTAQKLEAEPANARRELSAVRSELDTVIAEIRRFITAEESAGKSVDFCGVLRALVERARASTTAQIEVRCDPGADDDLSGAEAVQLANIAREALSNGLRHAKPQRLEITLRSVREAVVLGISDDGAGFDPKAPARRGAGLASMAARAQEMGGTLDIQSSPGRGTQVVVRVPVSSPNASEQNGRSPQPPNRET